MKNLLGTELLAMNAVGRVLVNNAIWQGREKCAGLSYHDPVTLDLISLYIELTIEKQIVDGQWLPLGIKTREAMGRVTVETNIKPCECGCGKPTVDIQVLLPAFTSHSTSGENKTTPLYTETCPHDTSVN